MASFGQCRNGFGIEEKGVDAGETIGDVVCDPRVLPAEEIVSV